jgi:hypothetical protein
MCAVPPWRSAHLLVGEGVARVRLYDLRARRKEHVVALGSAGTGAFAANAIAEAPWLIFDVGGAGAEP